MATIFETITELSGIVTDAVTAGVDTNIPARLIRTSLIKVSTGKYYEVLPIIVPAECCVIGDELRATNVQPRKASNSALTPTTDFNYTYHSLSRLEEVIDDVVSGVSVTPTTGNTETQTTSWPYAETDGPKNAVKRLARTIRRRVDIGLGNKVEATLTKAWDMSDPNYGYARDTVKLNKEFIQAEVIAYITTNYSSVAYSKTKCKQDVGFIIDAISYDLTYGGNWQSVKAGEAYWEGTNLQINSSEKTATLAAYGYLKTILQSISRNTTVNPALNTTVTQITSGKEGSVAAANTINSLMTNIIDIVTNGTGTETITYPSVSSVDDTLVNASTALQNIKSTVQENTIDFINGHFGSFQYNSAKCRRDLRNIITDTAYDVALGTNYNAVFNGRSYNRPNNAYNLQAQRTETVGAIRNARDLLKESVTDDGSSAGGSSNSSTRISTAYNEIVDMINNGLSAENALSFPNPVGVDQNRVDALDNLVANKTFIQADTVEYVNNTYGALVYNEGKCYRDVGYIVDALCYDILYGGTQATTRIAESYFEDGTSQLYGNEVETVAAYNHAKSIIGTIIQEGTVTAQSGHTEIQTKPGTPATATEEAELDAKIDIITAAITAGNLDSLPAPVYPSITWADAEYQNAHSNIFSDLEGVIVDTVQYINTTYSDFKYNQAKCSRDIGLLIDAARYDFMLGTNFASINAGLSYLRKPANKIVGNQKTATLAANEYVRTQLVASVGGNSIAIAGINTGWDWVQDIIWSGSAEGSNTQTEDVEVYNAVRQLELNKEFIVDELLAYVDDKFQDVVNGVITTDFSTDGQIIISDTSWLFEGMPIKFQDGDDSSNSVENAGLIDDRTYYVKQIINDTNFSISDTQYGAVKTLTDWGQGFKVLKGYEYNRALCARDVREHIDAIKWDLQWPQQQWRTYNKFGFDVSLYFPATYRTRLGARYYVNSIIGSQEEDFYYLRNGTGLRLQTMEGLQGDLGPANAFGTQRPTAGAYASLDPGWGPDDTRAWITARSPYVQNCTTFGYAAIGQKIDGALHNGGNDSIVSNDFTQVISDGIGAWILNNGRGELVSVFTYYSHVGYLCESGGRMRATNGNNSYGKFGSVAEGVDADETPVTAIVDNEKQYNAVIANVYTDAVNEILQLEYSHAGNDYTEAQVQIFGAGDSEELLMEEFRDEAVNQTRIIEVDDSTGNPDAVAGGTGYLVITNTAQTGNSTSLTIAATDGNSSTAYPGMKLYITSGAGVGLFGIIDTYNSGSKVATVVKESDGTAGWDHVVPGTVFESPNSSSIYLIEPRLSFTAPSRSDTTTTVASDVWPEVGFVETSAQYSNVAVTTQSDGVGATFDVTRNGSKYYISLNSGGTGYTRLDTITIPGTSLGGATTTNDITITITTVNSATGAVEEFDFSGYGRIGYFVALPDSGTTGQSSIDGTTWITNTLATSLTWKAFESGLIDDGSSTFKQSYAVAAGITASATAINYSLTGLSGTWSAPGVQPALSATSTCDLAFGQINASTGRFMLIADNDRDIAYSDDGGISWTTVANALPSTGYTALAFGAKKWVAIKGGSQEMAYSTDGGASWTTVAAGMPTTDNWVDIAYGKGRFVAICDDTDAGAYSLDGTEFTATTITTDGSTTPVRIAYGQGTFAVTTTDTNSLAYSEDGVYWPTPYAITATTYTGGLSAITFGNPDREPVFVAIQTGTTTAAGRFKLGCTTKARAAVASEKLFEVRISEPGSGYGSTPPTMTVTDPNNIDDALFTVRLNDGVLAQPTFIARGSGFIQASAEVNADNSNGFANFLQDGQFVAVRQLSSVPVNGSNVVFDSLPGTIFKLVNVVSRVGTKDGSYTAFLQLSPSMEIEDAVPNNDPVTMRIRFSQVRLTGHDFLDIGTGNFDDTNYPNSVYGDPVNDPSQLNETVSSDGGRVFFTATDQDGNFRVGDLFSIEQATGVATLNADAFNIAGLQELSLGEVTLGGNSASVTEFSTDPFFTANSDSIVPTQRAIKTYIEAQIGGGGASLVVNSVTAGDIFINSTQITTVSGATINIKANVNFTKSVLGLPLAYNYFLR
jgi:hypothetical protein